MLKLVLFFILAVGSMNCTLLFSETNGKAADAGIPRDDAGPPTWRQTDYVKGFPSEAGGRFGVSVSLSGNGTTLAVGSPSDSSGIGAVDVYIRENGSWKHQEHMVHVDVVTGDVVTGDLFGGAVSLSDDGNRLAVGASLTKTAGTGAGAVYVFARASTNWSAMPAAVILPQEADADDLFGGAVSLSGDGKTLSIGAEGEDSDATEINGVEDNNQRSDSGAVYIYSLGANNVWSKQAYLKSSAAKEGDGLGHSVSLNERGDVLAASAINEDTEEEDDSGAVLIFVRSEFESLPTWTQLTVLKADSPGKNDHFGESVSLNAAGTRVAIGAKDEDGASVGVNGDEQNNSATLAGATYVFAYDNENTGWRQEAYLKASNSGDNDWFGGSVALNGPGDTLIVGADHEDSAAVGLDGNSADNTLTKSGAAYIFVRIESQWSQQAYSKASNSDANDFYGRSVSIDLAGNTYVVGASGEASESFGLNGDQGDENAPKAGAAYLSSRIE